VGIDTSLFTFLNGFAGVSRLGDSLILFLGDKSPFLVALIFLVFVWKFTSDKKGAILNAAVSTILARGVFTELIRYFYHRPRPFSVMNVTQLIYEKNWSFPSGHATFFFALATAVYFYNKKWGAFFFIAAIVMGIARIMGGVHYPLDILGGAVIGIISAFAGRFLVQKFLKNYILRSPKTL